MAEVFVSYGHATTLQAMQVAKALRGLGYEVWRDEDLPPHRDYSEVIEERLRAAKAVVVVWSADAVKSQWVRAEAEIAREAGTLVQLSLDGAPLPLPFNRIQCADLKSWNGDLEAPGWLKVVGSIAELVGVRAPTVEEDGPARLALPDKPSIAVLPFDNLSGDSEQEYFADAITEDIITALSRWRWFFVIARNSSFTYKGAAVDVRRVGLELGVRYVLEGSVRKVGQRVRLTAQLVDCADGSHVCAHKYDRDLVDLLSLQDELTEEVVRAIEPAMLLRENVRLSRKKPNDYSALDCFQRGMWHLNKVSADHYEPAIALFREAIARDPDLALGYIGLSRILYGGATVYGWSAHGEQDLEESYRAAKRAIELDPGDADAYFACSGAALYLSLHEEALAMAQKSVALNPNSAYGQFRLAQVLIYAGRADEAIEPILHSLRHSPFDPQMGAMLGALALAQYQAKDYAAAVAPAREATLHNFPAGYALLGAALARLGRLEEAHEALPAELLNRFVTDAPRLATYLDPGDRDHFMGGLLAAVGGTPAEPAPGLNPG
ncbi:MAG TPA: TIR domain-containing protein [Phenylobacterium sp.]|uniref:TIR domain-containing protein n=1 Tax=Phenylobacterium sp. TaxID=1871053 RepID=UPI002F92C6BE